MRRSPPVMSFTFLAKSSAYSWKMSFAGHVLCQRMLCAPVDETTVGAPLAGSAFFSAAFSGAFSAAIANIGTAAAAAVEAAAPLRNLRRDALGCSGTGLPGFLDIASSGGVLGLLGLRPGARRRTSLTLVPDQAGSRSSCV